MLQLCMPLLEVHVRLIKSDLLNLKIIFSFKTKRPYPLPKLGLFYVFPGVDITPSVVVTDGWAISPPWIAW